MVEFEWQKLMLDTVLALVPVLTMAVIMLIGAGFRICAPAMSGYAIYVRRNS